MCTHDTTCTPRENSYPPSKAPKGNTASSKVGTPPIEAPISLTPPPQRLVLGPPDLARRGVLVASKLGGRALPHAAAETARRYRVRLCTAAAARGLCRVGRRRRGGDVPRGGEWGWRGGGGRGGGGRDGVVRGEGGFGGALEAFEFGLLGGRQARGGGGGLEGGGMSEGARGVEGCESAERAEEAGHCFLY